jgi:hypothetical protein
MENVKKDIASVSTPTGNTKIDLPPGMRFISTPGTSTYGFCVRDVAVTNLC